MATPVALSIRQPWAWCILHAGKDIENRTWTTSFRGRFLIHASKRWTVEERAIAEALRQRGVPVPEVLPLGALVGSAELTDCRPNQHDDGWAMSGQYGFWLRAPLAFSRPLALSGRLGFFAVPAQLLRDVLPGCAEAAG